MKFIKLLIILVITLNFFNCENMGYTNQLVLNIDAVIKETDSINVYYSNNRSIEFDEKQ